MTDRRARHQPRIACLVKSSRRDTPERASGFQVPQATILQEADHDFSATDVCVTGTYQRPKMSGT